MSLGGQLKYRRATRLSSRVGADNGNTDTPGACIEVDDPAQSPAGCRPPTPRRDNRYSGSVRPWEDRDLS